MEQTGGTQGNEGLRMPSHGVGMLTADWQTRQQKVDKIVRRDGTHVVPQDLQDQQLPLLSPIHMQRQTAVYEKFCPNNANTAVCVPRK